MDRRDVAFAAARGIKAAKTADRDGTRAQAALGQSADHDVERDIVAAHDHEVRRVIGLTDQRHLSLGLGVERRGERIDGQETVGLREGRHCTRSFSGWKRDQAVFRGDQ